MMEKNRDILKQTLQNLPEHKAGKSNWVALSAALDNLDASRFIQSNKTKLPDHKAPATAWNGIQRGLQSTLWTGTTGLLLKIGSVAVITAGVVSTAILLSDRKSGTEKENGPVPSEQMEVVTEPVPADPLKLQSRDEILPVQNNTEQTAEDQPESPFAVFPQDAEDLVSAPVNTVSQRINSEVGQEPTDRSLAGQHLIPGLLDPKCSTFTTGSSGLARIPLKNKYLRNRMREDYYRGKVRFDVSLGGSVSWMQFSNSSTAQVEVPGSVPAFGLDLLFDLDRWYLKTGLAYTSWEESGGYDFHYNKNELVYNYHYVDSAAFAPGTNQITYFTTEYEVYDSVYYLQPDVVRSRYRVLQIPLVLGYKLVESGRWMVGLNVGVGADINISKEVSLPVFEDEQSSLIGVDNHLVYRSPVNWRLMAGAGVFYRMSNRVSLFLEPAYQTFLNTVYPGADLSRPSYFEIKFGILYEF